MLKLKEKNVLMKNSEMVALASQENEAASSLLSGTLAISQNKQETLISTYIYRVC
jgi:hypothetical protein